MSKNSTPAGADTGTQLPEHVAVIMDGNGRWARKRGLPRAAGHRKGGESVRRLIRRCADDGISWLTVFAFSSENWRRPRQEVERLMELFAQALDKDIPDLHKNNIRFQAIGDIESLQPDIASRIRESELLTLNNTGMTFTVAVNYGGQWDITRASRAIAEAVQSGELAAGDITEAVLEDHLSTAGMPPPDLFIRTGGEQRISNFLLWQLAYTELYFTEVLWPDFGEQEFSEALAMFAARQRRFGQTSEQVEAV